MTDPIIRTTNPANIEPLCQLYHQFHEYHAQRLPARLRSLGAFSAFDSSQLRTTLQGILADPSAAVLVASLDGRIVGLVEVYLRRDDPNPMQVAYTYAHLQSLMVLESFRQRGLGTALVARAEAWARERGAAEMRLDIWEFPGAPLDFYQSIGYRTLKRQLVRKL
jgi:GNAT superfamily N-acetyltransferase